MPICQKGWVLRFFLAYIFTPWLTMTKSVNEHKWQNGEPINEWMTCSQCIMAEGDAPETVLGRDHCKLFYNMKSLNSLTKPSSTGHNFHSFMHSKYISHRKGMSYRSHCQTVASLKG